MFFCGNSGKLFTMKQTLSILNLLVEKGLLEKYAIGGAMGATFYTEPFTTFDLDVFVFFPKASGLLVDLTPIYAFLSDLGYTENVGECIMIEGTPVQFLPTTPGLLDEALEKAMDIDYDGVPTCVLKAEYLLAIDENILNDILNRYSLLERWNSWTKDE